VRIIDKTGFAYAINIADLTALPQARSVVSPMLLAPVTPHRIIVQAEPGRVDSGAVLLECDDARAEAIIHILRQKQPQKNLLRCYRRRGRGRTWQRVDTPHEALDRSLAE